MWPGAVAHRAACLHTLRGQPLPMPRATRYQAIDNAPHAGTIRARTNATTFDLVRDCTDAARAAVRVMGADAWPASLPRADAARIMHEFTQRAVRYEREDGDQLIRMPWRTVEDGEGDCKSTAVLIAAMCAKAGRRAVLRFVQYPGEDWFAHVYAVVDGVPVDPELTFGDEVLHSAHIDRLIR